MSALLEMQNGDNARPIGPELSGWSHGMLALLQRAAEIPPLPAHAPTVPAAFSPQHSPSPRQMPDKRGELWRAFLQAPTSDSGIHARNQLLESYWPLVKAIAHGLCRRLNIGGHAGLGMGMESFGPGAPAACEDMEQEGMVGLIAALDAFDPRHGVNFGHFARLKIRGAVLDALRRWRRAETPSTINGLPAGFVRITNGTPNARRHKSFDQLEFDDVIAAITMGMNPRQQAVARLWLQQQMSTAQIAAVLKLHISRVGQIRRGLLAQWRTDPRLQAMVN